MENILILFLFDIAVETIANILAAVATNTFLRIQEWRFCSKQRKERK